MTRLVGRFLRGPQRTPIAGAAIGIAIAGDRRVEAWATTDSSGAFLFRLGRDGPWSLRTRVQGIMLAVPIGYVSRDRNIDLVVSLGAVLAYEAGTPRRVSYG